MVKIYRNKKGWVKIVEAFVAILLITGVVLVLIDKKYVTQGDSSQKIYEAEYSVLKNIQLNDNLRSEILGINLLPNNVTANVNNSISRDKPDYLSCSSKVCNIGDPCLFDGDTNTDIYARSVIIAANSTSYSPRQLKLFCWMK